VGKLYGSRSHLLALPADDFVMIDGQDEGAPMVQTRVGYSHFADRLLKATESAGPCVVGLDPYIPSMAPAWLHSVGYDETWGKEESAELLYRFNIMVLKIVRDFVAIVKPQIAYYERYGAAGLRALERTIQYARQLGMLVVLDAKRGDIPSTDELYAQAYLDSGENGDPYVDAMTVNPYLGLDSLEPFLKRCERGAGIFVCVKTSNAGAGAVQDLRSGDRLIYEHVAEIVARSADVSVGESGYSGVGAVVGATWPDDAIRLRSQMPQAVFLVPGIGTQGGDPTMLPSFFNGDGRGAIVATSRSVLYPHLYGDASSKPDQAIHDAVTRFVRSVKRALETQP
jgi:orotidine-5'-phosphate decarboxylase